jgi:hypothetical protein
VQLRSLRHASTQEDGQTIRRKHAPAAGKRQIHARISRSEGGRHALPCVYPLRTHLAHASPLAYCYPYACNQRMCHIACVVAQVETQPYAMYCDTPIRLKWQLYICLHYRKWLLINESLLIFQHFTMCPVYNCYNVILCKRISMKFSIVGHSQILWTKSNCSSNWTLSLEGLI